MNLIDFKCPGCGKEYQLNPAFIGKKVKCKKCANISYVPDDSPLTLDTSMEKPSVDRDIEVVEVKEVPGRKVRPALEPVASEGAKPSREEEITVLVRNPSLLSNTGWFIAGVVCVLLGIAMVFVDLRLTILFAGAGVIILVALWLARYFDEYTVTTKRIIDREGLIARRTVEIFLKDIRSINIRQNILQRLFRVGDIHIGTAGTAGLEISIEGISHPQKVKETIIELKEKLL